MSRSTSLIIAALALAAALPLSAQDSNALVDEARALLASGRPADAERLARRYLDTHQDAGDIHFLLGYILFKEQRAKESLAEYTEGAKYKKPNAYDLETVAGDYVLLKDYPDADKWFTKSAEWNPGNFQVLYYLARTKYNENRFEEAVAAFLECLKLDPKNVKAEDNLGLSYEGLGRTNEALDAYQKAIAWQQGAAVREPGPYLDMGALLVAGDRASEAVPFLLEALKLAPDQVRGHRELGKAYLHADQLEKAQAELEASVRLDPQHAPTHFVLAQVYRKRGMLDKARTETAAYNKLSVTRETDTR